MTTDGRAGRIAQWMGAATLACLLVASAAFGQQAGLSAPATAAPGAMIEIAWQGPAAAGDFVAIAEPSASSADFVVYARTSGGSPAVLTAPEAGEYEIRYISAAGLEILARAPLTVGVEPAQAGIKSPSEVEAGADLLIAVTEPGDPADYVTIVGAGEPDDAFGPYARLRGGREVMLTAPGKAGGYEIRQVRASTLSVLARASLTVVPAPEDPAAAEPADAATPEAQAGSGAAQVQPPAAPGPRLVALVAVDRAHTFRVAWTGPGAEGDRIAVLAKGDGPEVAVDSETTQSGSPVSLTAPDAPGDYEIIYLDGASGQMLARRDLEVR